MNRRAFLSKVPVAVAAAAAFPMSKVASAAPPQSIASAVKPKCSFGLSGHRYLPPVHLGNGRWRALPHPDNTGPFADWGVSWDQLEES